MIPIWVSRNQARLLGIIGLLVLFTLLITPWLTLQTEGVHAYSLPWLINIVGVFWVIASFGSKVPLLFATTIPEPIGMIAFGLFFFLCILVFSCGTTIVPSMWSPYGSTVILSAMIGNLIIDVLDVCIE